MNFRVLEAPGGIVTLATLTAAVFYFGTGAPASTLGGNGDLYLDAAAGNFYANSAGTWAIVYSVPTPTATSSANLAGSRALGTVYQNTSGKIWLAAVSASAASAGGNLFVNVSTGATGFPGATGGAGTGAVVPKAKAAFAVASYAVFACAIVPPGSYYNVTTDGITPTVTTWSEDAMS